MKNATRVDVGKLPSVPQVLLKLIEACHKVDVSFDELAEIIKQDTGLSSKILAIGNSSAYAQWNSIKDFNRLLVVLGLKTIRTISITTAVQQFFSQFDAGIGKQMGRFWIGSLTCAHMARALARLIGYAPLDEAYLAGLLHNLGQLVYLKRYPAAYAAILTESITNSELDAQEREQFGATYAEMGAYLIKEWNPGSFVSDAILFQHEPAEAIYDTHHLVKTLNLAHKLSSGGISSEKLLEDADRLFGLSQPMLDELRTGVDAQVLEITATYGFQIRPGGPAKQDFNVDDEQARLKLTRQVKSFALLGSVQTTSATDEFRESQWRTLLQDVNILFGLDHTIAFEYDPEATVLRSVMGFRKAGLTDREFTIPLKPERSMVSESILAKRTMSSYDAGETGFASVLDQQLKRSLETEHLLSLPLLDTEHNYGVIVAGVAPEQIDGLRSQDTFLAQFGRTASEHLAQRLNLEHEQQQLLDEQHARYDTQLGKLGHEANNPLGVIKNYLQVLSVKLDDDPKLQSQVTILKEEIDRVAGIILRIRDVGDWDQTFEGSVDINTLINDLVGIFRASLFSTHDISDNLALDAGIPPVTIHRNALKQILTNLIKNAVEAMPDGGHLAIETLDQVNMGGKSCIQIMIADSGPGLPPGILEKVFTPVTSTKGENHSGLGLTIVKNIITDLGGYVSCRNRAEGGAEFTLQLPRDE